MKSQAPNVPFSDNSSGAWAKKAEIELGISPSDRPFMRLNNGQYIEAYYKKLYLELDELRFQQNAQKHAPGFNSLAPVAYPKHAFQLLEEATKKGVDGIVVYLENWDIEALENWIRESKQVPRIPVFYKFNNNDFQKWQASLRNCSNQGGWAIDPITNWMKGLGPYEPILEAIAHLEVNQHQNSSFTTIEIGSHHFYRAGAQPSVELALTVATLVTYMDYFTEKGFLPKQALSMISFSVEVGTQYLTEIAKLRALRVLIVRVGMHYGVTRSDIAPNVTGRCAVLQEADDASFLNLIRMSSEAMSLAVGGCNAILMGPFSHSTSIDRETASSLPLNIPLILRHEASLDKVADPAAGSYLLEHATHGLAEEAWSQFLDIEAQGGLIPYFHSGAVRDLLDSSWSISNKHQNQPGSQTNDSILASPMIPSRRGTDVFESSTNPKQP